MPRGRCRRPRACMCLAGSGAAPCRRHASHPACFVPHPPFVFFAGDKWCVYPSYDFTHCLVSGQVPWSVAYSWRPDGDNAATG